MIPGAQLKKCFQRLVFPQKIDLLVPATWSLRQIFERTRFSLLTALAQAQWIIRQYFTFLTFIKESSTDEFAKNLQNSQF